MTPAVSISHARRRRQGGQSVVEFAVIFPVFLLLVVAIGDFGRIYTSAVAVEAATREAADFGSFKAEGWTVINTPTTVAAMEKRACTAAAGSHLDGYDEPAGTIDHATCTNPTFSYRIEHTDGTDATTDASCSDRATEPPCVVHVRMDYDFRPFIAIGPIPAVLHIGRDSRYRMQDLDVPAP